MSLLATVAREVGAGGSAGSIAARLGRDRALVDLALAELERLGRVAPVPTGCGPCPPAGAASSPACAGCPLAGRRA